MQRRSCYYAPGLDARRTEGGSRKCSGKFDQGWDKVREETFERQKKLGVIPTDAKLTPRAPGVQAWDTLSAEEKRVFSRFMEVYAGYLEQTDHNIGRVLKTIEDLGQLDNTLVIYIAGDNGASAEGSLQGLLNEMTFFNGVPEDLKEVLKRADDIGTWKTYNHYPVGWANAMCTPFQWTKQIANYLRGCRSPDHLVAEGDRRQERAADPVASLHRHRADFARCGRVTSTIFRQWRGPEAGEGGMIITQGGLFSGWALYLDRGKPVFHSNFVDVAHYEVVGKDPLAAGQHAITMDFAYDGGSGIGRAAPRPVPWMAKEVAKGRVEKTVPIRISLDEGLDVGEDTGTPVNLSYDVPFKFTGKIAKAVIDLK